MNSWKQKSYPVYNNYVLNIISAWRSTTGRQKIALQNTLINKTSYIIYSKIKKLKDSDIYEDLVQEGIAGIVEAMQKFDERRSPNFFMVADWYVKNNIKSFLQKLGQQKDILDEPIDIEAEYEKKERKELLGKLINELPQLDRDVVTMRFGLKDNDKYSLRDIGKHLSISHEQVRLIEKRVISKIKNNHTLAEAV